MTYSALRFPHQDCLPPLLICIKAKVSDCHHSAVAAAIGFISSLDSLIRSSEHYSADI
jgi:hypothetical protein